MRCIPLKVLHTADVHLTPAAPERMKAFRTVCDLTVELGCSALLIAGDLFDTAEAAASLRAEVRELFDSYELEFFLIPGNHDRAAFCSGEYYGRNVHSCGETAVKWELQGTPIIGIPYLPGRQGVDLLHSSVKGEDLPSIVIMHTNFYDSSLSALYFSDDKDDSRSACLWEHDISDLPAAYIALGHWHNPTLPPIRVNQVQLAYSGTPYPIAKGENGARRAFLIDLSSEGIDVQAVEIPGVPRRETASFFFVPAEEKRVMEEIASFLEQQADHEVILDLEVAGWVGSISEDICTAEIEMLVKKYRRRWRDVNCGTVQVTGISALPGIAIRCLRLLDELEPPAPLELEDLRDPCLKELSQEVIKDREGLYRTALSLLLQQMGRGT
ncbi:MAG: metallophosphoesterase [Thermoanaerobacterales bacterium]|nr:metallophosphoesterase [Thermoanaerobacterales bacterium]